MAIGLWIRIRMDPEPHGSAFIGPSGSGSTFKMRIRIQVEKIEGKKKHKVKIIGILIL